MLGLGRTSGQRTHGRTAPRSGVLLDSAISVDRAEGTVTLPLFGGTYDGKAVSYLVTESFDRDGAERRGVNDAPKLTNALGTRAVQEVRVTHGVVRFSAQWTSAPNVSLSPAPTASPAPVPAWCRRRRGVPPSPGGVGAAHRGTRGLDVRPQPERRSPSRRHRAPEQRPLSDHPDHQRPTTWPTFVQHGLLASAGTGPANESLKGLQALPGISDCPLVLEPED